MKPMTSKCRECRNWNLACGEWYCAVCARISPGQGMKDPGKCSYFESKKR